MPTLNPRVNVTLSPSLDALVSTLAKLERVSKANVLRELLETAEPALQQVVALMQAAESAGPKARAAMKGDLENMLKAGEGTAAMMLSLASGHTKDIVSQAESIRARRPAVVRAQPSPAGARPGGVGAKRRPGAKAPGAAKRPPLSNRGVKS